MTLDKFTLIESIGVKNHSWHQTCIK